MHHKKKNGWRTATALVCLAAVAVTVILVVARLSTPPFSSPPRPVAGPESIYSHPAPASSPHSVSGQAIGTATGDLELPAVGATGFTLIDTALRPRPFERDAAESVLPPGAGFAVMEEQGGWWRVEGDGFLGWVLSGKCMVNLPDVIPSIIYDNTNAYSAVYRTCGKDIPNITGHALYEARLANERLGREEFVMPVLYPMAKRIWAAQRAALAEGNTLVLIEAFRPWAAQQAVVGAVTTLAAEDEEVNEAIHAPPWGIDWFISTGVSNHQQGYAVDLTLAKVDAWEEAFCGPYGYTRITAHTRYEMPTPIHELSPASAAMAGPLDPRSKDWRAMAPAPGMNGNALALQRYCTGAGMTPLASEWWHFNDYAALDPEIAAHGTGGFTANACRSFVPQAANQK